MAQSGSIECSGQPSRGSPRERGASQPGGTGENVSNNPANQPLVCQYRDLLRQSDETHTLERRNEIRLQLRAIENKVISKALEGINDLIKIQQMKEAQSSKLATRDNYWGDWLPQFQQTLTRLQKSNREFRQLIREVKVFRI